VTTRAERLAALEVEADRLKERLDVLDRQLQGDPDAWLQLTVRMPDTVAEVYVDKLLGEARQQALAYATLVRTIDQLAGEGGEEKPQSQEDDLVKRRQEREAARKAAVAAQA
jgi:hypothetical protein